MPIFEWVSTLVRFAASATIREERNVITQNSENRLVYVAFDEGAHFRRLEKNNLSAIEGTYVGSEMAHSNKLLQKGRMPVGL